MPFLISMLTTAVPVQSPAPDEVYQPPRCFHDVCHRWMILVLGDHEIFATGFPRQLTSVRWFFDGNLGVRFFFTISGFLITWLLLQEWKATGAINLRNFYLRRCLRILPVFWAFLLTVWIVSCFVTGFQNSHSWVACLTFTRNTFGWDPISAHLWSLSVEEQFYLFWPTCLLLLLARCHWRNLVAVVLLIILMAPVFRGATEMVLFPEYPTAHPPTALVAWLAYILSIMAIKFISVADSLAFGWLAGVLLYQSPAAVRVRLTRRPGLAAGIALLCIMVPHAATHAVRTPTVLCVQLATSLQALGFSILLLQSILIPKFAGYRALNWKPVIHLGVLSYSVYIWQQFFWGAPSGLGIDRFWWLGLWIPPLLAVVALSYYAMEARS